MLRMFTPGREIGSEKMALADRSAVLLVIEKLGGIGCGPVLPSGAGDRGTIHEAAFARIELCGAPGRSSRCANRTGGTMVRPSRPEYWRFRLFGCDDHHGERSINRVSGAELWWQADARGAVG